jgi:hypothetical protein
MDSRAGMEIQIACSADRRVKDRLELRRSRSRQGNVKTLTRLMPAATAALALFLGSGALADEPPLTPVSSTPLPAVTGGDFDHFAVDLAHDRLFVPAEVYASIEVFELKSGKHLSSARGVAKSPHKLELIPDKNELLVADAGDASCKILDAKDLQIGLPWLQGKTRPGMQRGSQRQRPGRPRLSVDPPGVES